MSTNADWAKVDCHAHVVDPERYPFHPTSTYKLLPNETCPVEQYQAVLYSHGFTNGVLINPLGGYGTDCRYMLDAIASSRGRLKGIAVVPHDVSVGTLQDFVARGVVGLRYSVHHPSSPGLSKDAVRVLEAAKDLGLFIELHYLEDQILDVLPLLRASGVKLIVDHCGRPDISRGIGQPGFQALLELGREGHAVVKLSAAFRFTRQRWPYADVEPYIAALIESFTLDRCIWGSDWPFVRMDTRIDFGPMLACLERWLPDPTDLRKVLGGNPCRLFGFDRKQAELPNCSQARRGDQDHG